jgi:PAS domain S-box-containing protein
MRALIDAHDWSGSPLGSPEQWSQSLKTTVGLILPAMAQVVVFWGPEFVALYNDAYAPTIGEKHPRALGRPARENWAELWDDLEPLLASVRDTGQTVSAKDRPFHIERFGYPETVYFDISYSAVPDEGGGVGGVLCIVSETTERVMTERRMREEEARFHAMADSVDQMIWSTLPDGFHDYYNQRWYDYTGVPEGSTDGEGWNDMFHPEDRERAWAIWRRCLETGEPYHIEYRLRHRSGVYRWVLGRAQAMRDADGAIIRWYGTCTDIHDFKTAEQALRESEEFNRRILASSNDCIKVLSLDAKLESMSPGGLEVMEIDDFGAVKGAYWPDLWGESERHLVKAAIDDALAGRTGRFEGFCHTGRGTLKRWDVIVSSIDGEDGAPEKLLSISRDITTQYRANEAIRESEARFRAMADSAPSPVWVTNATGIEFVNKAFEALAGKPAEDLTGEAWIAMIDPEDLPDVLRRQKEAWAQCADYGYDARFRVADGAKRWLKVSCRTRFDGQGALIGYVGMAVDITDAKRAELRLRESEERLRVALAAGQLGDWYWDIRTDLINFSAQAAALFGVDEGPVISWTDMRKLIDPADAPAAFAEVDAAVREHRDYAIEFRMRRGKGRLVWISAVGRPVYDAEGEPTGVIGVVQDISARKRTEEKLEEDKRTLETLNRISASLAPELDLQRVVQMVTDAGVELSGAQFGAFFYNVTDAGGESYMLYAISGVDRGEFDKFPMPRNTAIFAPTFGGEGAVRSDDITKDPRYGHTGPHHGMPKGHLPVASYLAVPVTSRSGEVIGGLFFGHEESARFSERHEQLLVGIAGQAAVAIDNARLFEGATRELAERKRAEEALLELNQSLESRIADAIAEREQAEAALRQAQKMEAVGQLTGGIAHDFNNLLTIITGNIDAARRHVGEEGSPRVQRALASAAVGADRAATLTQRLLAFSRRQPLNPRQIDPNKLIANMGDLLHRTLGETVEVETVLAAGLWRVEADPNQLENAILNLAVNARDAMPGGGKMTIETTNMHLDRDYAERNAGALAGQYVAICVSDTGSGMDSETLARAFEPFFTTKEVGKGTGLGLSQVYGFVKQSGGHLKIYSEVGQGTTVRIYLPRLLAEEVVEEERAEPPVPEGGREETILVCEDDDDVRAYTVEVLRELGYRVLEAHDGPSALRLLERQEGRVDMLFTDVVLPSGMTGAVVAQEVRKLRPDIKVLFTTGYARNAIVHHGRLDPGVELITKPFAYADLAARIRDMLDGG